MNTQELNELILNRCENNNLDLGSNQITSLEGVNFPEGLEELNLDL